MGDHTPPTQESVIQAYIRELEARSKKLKDHADNYLKLIFVVLALSVFAVVYAAELAQSDIDSLVNVSKKISKTAIHKDIKIERERRNIASNKDDLLDIKQEIVSATQGHLRIWVPLYPEGLNDRVTQAQFLSSKVGYAKTSQGFYKTEDGGRNWYQASVPYIISIRNIHYVTENLAFAYDADGNVYKTTDAWNKYDYLMKLSKLLDTMQQEQPDGFDLEKTAWITTMFFLNENHGWVMDSNGYLHSTQDGGKTWKSTFVNNDHEFTKLAFSTPADGYALGFGELIYTSDGGKNWDYIENIPSFPDGIEIIDFATSTPRDLMVVTSERYVLNTNDGGTTWHGLNVPLRSYTALALNKPHFGWLFHEEGKITHSKKYEGTLTADMSNDQFLQILESDKAPYFIQETRHLDEFYTVKSRIEQKQDEIASLVTDIQNLDEAAKTIAESDSRWYFSLAINGIRIGTLVIAFFLVQILVGMYRYNMRLASVYHAYADALQLTPLTSSPNAKFDTDTFLKLIENLSPNHLDFGKAPTAITEKLVDTLRDTVAKVKP